MSGPGKAPSVPHRPNRRGSCLSEFGDGRKSPRPDSLGPRRACRHRDSGTGYGSAGACGAGEAVGVSGLHRLPGGREKLQTTKRHLSSAFGTTPAAYRERWGLPSDYPMVAANYSKARSGVAKALGLGRKAAEPVPTAEPVRAAFPGHEVPFDLTGVLSSAVKVRALVGIWRSSSGLSGADGGGLQTIW